MTEDARRIAISTAALDPNLVVIRKDLALLASRVFSDVGIYLHLAGYALGNDRKEGKSPFEYGSDEVVGMSVLLRIGSQLISASAELLTEGRRYAAAALLRQIVEIEYLAWAFEYRDRDAERWLRSDREIRERFFRPAKLRSASKGRFGSEYYRFHCEFGGHPAPTVTALLNDDAVTAQVFLFDLLGHTGQIWNHCIAWDKRNEGYIVDYKVTQRQCHRNFRIG